MSVRPATRSSPINKSSLNRHLKAHEKRVAERTFTCSTCGEIFHNLAPYNAHIRTSHQLSESATTSRQRPATKTTDTPAAKKTKKSASPTAPQASAAAASESSWAEDPILIPANVVPAAEDNITETCRQHWLQIRTRFNRRNHLQD